MTTQDIESRRFRAGRYRAQPTGSAAFIPAPLPPDPSLVLSEGMLDLLARANLAVGRLDGSAHILPNPDLFVGMYVHKEAVLSSQIEGTQASLDDVLGHNVRAGSKKGSPDVEEVVNYVRAMNHGLERLRTLPLSNRLLRELHHVLLQGVAGAGQDPWRVPHSSKLDRLRRRFD